MSKKTSFYLNEKLAALLAQYAPRWGKDGSISAPLTTFADRYDAIMRAERRTLRELFTPRERDLMIANAPNMSSLPGDLVLEAVLIAMEDVADSVFELYGVDRSALLDKLRALTPGQRAALVDWLEDQRI